MSFVVKIKERPSFSVKLRNVSINTSGGYDEGYANGKADAEAADAIEDEVLLGKINTALRNTGGTYIKEDAPTLADVPEKVPYVYDNGFERGFVKGLEDGKTIGEQSEYDRFWDAYQQNGARVNYENAFGCVGWTAELFNPKYDIQPTKSYMMFRNAGIKDLTNLSVALDFSKSTNMQYMFQWSRVEKIGTFDARSVNDLNSTFTYVSYLHTIEKLILRDDGTNAFTATFTQAKALQNITIEGVIGNTLDMRYCEKLTRDSIESVIGALSDSTTDKSITLSEAAITSAYGSTDSGHWLVLCDTKPNWTISLV